MVWPCTEDEQSIPEFLLKYSLWWSQTRVERCLWLLKDSGSEIVSVVIGCVSDVVTRFIMEKVPQ